MMVSQSVIVWSFKMQQQVRRFLLFLLIVVVYPTEQSVAQIADSAILRLADPAIIFGQQQYHLYGTVEGKTGEGFVSYHSNDLEYWTKDTGMALKKGEAFGTANFWAPQVFKLNQQFYMAYVANEQIAIATSTSPSGPFKQEKLLSLEAPVKQIDPFVFIDEDGKKYLYHVRLTKGNKIFVAELKSDLSAIKPGTLQECITATQPWENTANSNWPVTEGPSIIKHKKYYYLFYTANDFRNPDYAVGYAVSKSPLGPWQKFAGNPIISKQHIGVNGPGHGDFFRDKNNQLKYVLHTHQSDSTVGPRRTALVDVRFVPGQPTDIDKVGIVPGSFHFLRATRK
ncbi:MAG: glycoside hydrolase family 43 protein [Ferruginibacter sp.]|nr:glycoside hydrolase family 43 protein [Ferruginibacter sp.]